MSIIHADQITKIYQGRGKHAIKALNAMSLDVHDGEIFGLLGPNGAGKTTFIKVLLGIVHPTSGHASMLERPLGTTAAKSHIGYLPENHRYPDFLTGEQVLRYFGKLSGVRSDELEARIESVLDLVDMSQWRKTKIRKYSKGMLQRVGLAQALINNPRLVILDEPTDGVDPIGRKQIRDILVRLRDDGTTVFLNSHLLSEVELICDRVGILKDGEIVRLGAVGDLTTKREMYIIGVAGEPPPELLLEWEAKTLRVEFANHTLHLRCENLHELNQVIDALRTHGVMITSIQQQRQSLEDMFIRVISGEESE